MEYLRYHTAKEMDVEASFKCVFLNLNEAANFIFTYSAISKLDISTSLHAIVLFERALRRLSKCVDRKVKNTHVVTVTVVPLDCFVCLRLSAKFLGDKGINYVNVLSVSYTLFSMFSSSHPDFVATVENEFNEAIETAAKLYFSELEYIQKILNVTTPKPSFERLTYKMNNQLFIGAVIVLYLFQLLSSTETDDIAPTGLFKEIFLWTGIKPEVFFPIILYLENTVMGHGKEATVTLIKNMNNLC